MKATELRELEDLPGVGKRIAEVFRSIGIRKPQDLKGKSPEKLYKKLCEYRASPVDRCLLYVFRCAVYSVSRQNPDPELLKWWNWKDKPTVER